MRTAILDRLAPWGGALALVLGCAYSCPAQDGQSPTGPPTTNPRTNDQAPPNSTNRPESTGQVLPAIPETASDPAPPGTRGVRVDAPRTGTAPGAAPANRGRQPGQGGTAARRPTNVLTAEGVVTRIDRAGDKLNGELVRFAFDPSQDWYSYMNRGAQNVAAKDEERPKGAEEIKEANEKQHEETPDRPNVLEMAITKRTYVFTHARSEDGTDQYGAATSASPDTTSSRSGLTNRPDAVQPTRPVATNFTNIKEGSFVAVRYRKVGDLNEVLNLTLIELPLNNPASMPDPALPAAPGRIGTGTGTTGAGTGTGAGAGAGTGAGTGTSPAGTGAGQTPTVPTTPVGPALPR